jgi:glycosyltransferase involved in cell wall biosynthesis
MAGISVSVVIPTRNRPDSLHRALAALANQTRVPEEVIVCDASDAPGDPQLLGTAYPTLNLSYFLAAPSVCAQRNEGIRRANSSHVLLCDDDIEPPPDYVQRLAAVLESNPQIGAVSGVWSEPDAAGRFSDPFPVPRFRDLAMGFVTQRSVWGDVEATSGNLLTSFPLALLKRWYRRRGNTWSLSGFPLLTQVRAAVVRTAVYTLGSALVRRDWLLASPYDERAGEHGAGGDNYGVALGFPDRGGIALLTDLTVRHHREQLNRIDRATGFYHRALFLHEIMRRSRRFSAVNRTALAWTLVTNAAEFRIRGQHDLFRASLRALHAVLTGRNPLFGSREPVAPAPRAEPQP